MAFFKKAGAAILALTMSFSFVGCGGDNQEEKDDGLFGGLIDPDYVATGEGEKYLEGIMDSFVEANTITADFSFAMTQTEDGEQNTANITASCVMAKTENGYNVKAEGTASMTEGGETMSDPFKLYFVDGYAYEYDADEDAWDKELVEYDDYALILEQVYGFLQSEDVDGLYQTFGPYFEQLVEVKDNKIDLDLDAKPDLDNLINFAKNIKETDNAKTVIDNFLKAIGADITTSELFEEISDLGEMTVEELYEELNDLIKDLTGYTISELQQEILTFIQSQMPAPMQDYDDLENGGLTIFGILSTDIEQLIAPYKDMTVNDLLTAITGEPITLDAIVSVLDQTLKTMPAQELIEELEMDDFIETLRGLTINKMQAGVDVLFDNYKLQSITTSADVDFAVTDGDDTLAIVLDFDCSFVLSNQTTVITLPEMNYVYDEVCDMCGEGYGGRVEGFADYRELCYDCINAGQ